MDHGRLRWAIIIKSFSYLNNYNCPSSFWQHLQTVKRALWGTFFRALFYHFLKKNIFPFDLFCDFSLNMSPKSFWHPQRGQCPTGSPILLPEWSIHYSCISWVNLLDAIMTLKIFTFLMEKVGWTLKKWYCWLYKFEIIPFQLGKNPTRVWLKSKGQKWALLGIYKSGLVQKMWLYTDIQWIPSMLSLFVE